MDDFWARVAPSQISDCWLWLGPLSATGFALVKGSDSAKKVAWEAVCGPVPSGMCVLRLCDGDACVRPDHMVLWAEWDVGGMARLRGTRAAGQGHGRSKMTDTKVMEARRRWAQGEAATALAREYGMGHTPMDYLLAGKTWAHLPVIPRRKWGAHATLRGGAR